MPERNAEMTPNIVDLSPQARNQLRVAVFDLHNGDLIGNMDENNPLFRDFQIVNELGLPGIDYERRAVTIGTRLLRQFIKPLDPTRKTVTLLPYGHTAVDGVEPVGRVIEVRRDPIPPLLPPMRTLGALVGSSEQVHGHAVATRTPVFRRELAANLKRHDAMRMLAIAQKEVDNEGSTELDRIDAEFIVSAFHRNEELFKLAEKSAQYSL